MPDKKNALYGLHCYSLGQTYMLPTSAVLEVVPYLGLDESEPKGCLIGMLNWRERKIPVVNLGLNSPFIVTPLSHIMIFKCLYQDKLMLVGAVVGQIPRPIQIGPEDLKFIGKKDRCFYPVSGKYLEAQIIDLTQLGEELEKAGLHITKTDLNGA